MEQGVKSVTWIGSIVTRHSAVIPFLAAVDANNVVEFKLTAPLIWSGPCRGKLRAEKTGDGFTWTYDGEFGRGSIALKQLDVNNEQLLIGTVYEGNRRIGVISLFEERNIRKDDGGGGWDTGAA